MRTRRIVAIVMNELTDYSFELCAGSQALLSAHGYQPMIITGKHLDDPTAKANNLIYQALHSTQFAGALIHTFTLENSSSPTRLPRLLATLGDLPIVSIGAKLADYASITVKQSSGMVQLMEHLLARKRFQRYLFVRGLPTNADSLFRENIFRNLLEQQGLLEQAAFITGNFDGDVVYKEVYTRCQTELQRAREKHIPFTPTAVVCANDRMAVAAIEAVKAAGLRVPENVAVTGFDNSRECDNSQVPLTTVAQPLRSMGEQAAQMLVDQLAGKIVADRTVPTQFIIRASCGGSATPAPHAPTPQPMDCLDLPPAPTIKTAIKQRNYLSHLQTDLNIKLMEKNTLAEMKQALLQLLPRMSIQSCFLILYANPQHVFESPAQLFMTYDESDPTLVNRFIDRQIDRDELLPEELLTDERLGMMCELTPLVVGSDIYGYMLMAWNDHYFVDFLTLPIVISSALRNIYQLQSLKEYALELERKVEERTRELHLVNQHLVHEVQERRNGELALMAANEKLERLASIDELTQLKNRRMLDLFLLEQCQSQGGLAAPLSLLFADIDYFKKFNDTYGHQAGDDCLRAVADVFKTMASQKGGMAARYGGEEFALVLPDCEHCEAIAIAKQLLAEVADLRIQNAASIIAAHVTLSIGITTSPAGISPTTDMLIAHADQALYRAKSNGRNCFACYHEPALTLSSPSVFLSRMLTSSS